MKKLRRRALSKALGFRYERTSPGFRMVKFNKDWAFSSFADVPDDVYLFHLEKVLAHKKREAEQAMAYKPKTYRKFVAAASTATMVAQVITPEKKEVTLRVSERTTTKKSK